MQNERIYRCSNILTESGLTINEYVVKVPMIDLTEVLDQQENRDAIFDTLESFVGPVEQFNCVEL